MTVDLFCPWRREKQAMNTKESIISRPQYLVLHRFFPQKESVPIQATTQKCGSIGRSTRSNPGLQWIAVRASPGVCRSVLLCVVACCSVLQCVAACCNVLQCAAVCWNVLQCVAVYRSILLHIQNVNSTITN